MPKILISYRRSDSAGMTGRIFDRLVQKYGTDSIFVDVDNIPFGTDFRTHIKDALLKSDLMLVIIGQRWLGRGEGPGTRMDDESDPVRVEVESALKAKIKILPLLVDGASMPKSSELPEPMRELAYLNAASINSGRDFGMHIDRVVRSIDQMLEQAKKPAPAPSPPVAPVASAAPPAASVPPMPAPTPKPAEPPRKAEAPALAVAMDASGNATLKLPALGIDLPHHQRVAIVMFAIALLGPVLGLMLGKGPGLADNLRVGAYSLPMAIFGVASLLLPVRNPKDYFGGALLVGLGLFAMWASSDLPGMRGFAFGPGTAPRLFAWGLIILGVAVTLVGLFTDGPPEEPFAFSGPLGGAVLVVALIPITYYANRIGHVITGVPPDIVVAFVGAAVVLALAFLLQRVAPRGPLFITAATLIFAVTVRPLGLVFASFVSLMVSAYATHEIRWIEMLIWAVVLTIFCSLLFPWGLNLPLQLWPRF